MTTIEERNALRVQLKTLDDRIAVLWREIYMLQGQSSELKEQIDQMNYDLANVEYGAEPDRYFTLIVGQTVILPFTFNRMVLDECVTATIARISGGFVYADSPLGKLRVTRGKYEGYLEPSAGDVLSDFPQYVEKYEAGNLREVR